MVMGCCIGSGWMQALPLELEHDEVICVGAGLLDNELRRAKPRIEGGDIGLLAL
jgi:hypothetical protein